MRYVLRAVLCAALLAPAAARASDGRSLVFDLYRKDKKVGSHSLRFIQKGNLLTVDINIDIKGKIFFIPFTYRHINHEVWRGSVLQSLSSTTYVNDKPVGLSVQARAGGFDVEADGKASRIEGDIKTTSYWYPGTASQARLLNTQNGKVIPITASAPLLVQAPLASGGKLAARETRMTDQKKFNANVVYDANNCFVGLNFKPPFDSTLVVYRLVAQPFAKDAPDLMQNPLIAKCVSGTGTVAGTRSVPPEG
jgi:hypothetical protein